MPYRTWMAVVLASAVAEVREEIQQALAGESEKLVELAVAFLSAEVTPESSLAFEEQLDEACRELGRVIAETVYNRIEPGEAEADKAPHDVRFEAGGYRQKKEKTPNRHVATLFGPVTLWRFGYRYWHRDEQESMIFPLEIQLGLVASATPAVASRAARYLAEAGATQKSVRQRLRSEHNLRWGEKRLRKVAAEVSRGMERFREEFQVQRLLALLQEAYTSRGKFKPVLCAGRDGISLGTQPHGFFENASTGTVSVYDRRGRRLGTVYLACPPEPGQPTMTAQLRNLITEVLRRRAGPLPRLCYVTDAGEHESRFYREVLRPMRDPQRPRERLKWHWIVDYYHASEKITVMSEALFRSDQEARSWATKMRKALLKPNGPSRVLHSAAALRSRRGLNSRRRKEFERAYNYIRRRTRFMRYHEFRRVKLPIGSGVTEAACKTVFTQRLKLSGMRWKDPGSQAVLGLRVVLLSDLWDAVYRELTRSDSQTRVTTYGNLPAQIAAIAA